MADVLIGYPGQNERDSVGDPLVAPPGSVWVCGVCGKRSRDRYGRSKFGPVDCGWDESCMLNAVLVSEGRQVRRVSKKGV